MKENNLVIKARYSMEVSGNDLKKLVWKEIVDYFVNDKNKDGKIGIQGFGFVIFDGYDGK